MAQSNGTEQSADDKLLFLKKEQEQFAEGSFEYADLEAKINQIVAQNYLEYVNR